MYSLGAYVRVFLEAHSDSKSRSSNKRRLPSGHAALAYMINACGFIKCASDMEAVVIAKVTADDVVRIIYSCHNMVAFVYEEHAAFRTIDEDRMIRIYIDTLANGMLDRNIVEVPYHSGRASIAGRVAKRVAALVDDAVLSTV
jgi:hypothetical protein